MAKPKSVGYTDRALATKISDSKNQKTKRLRVKTFSKGESQ